ncbi:MAG: diacylglycerol/lipid kinase family protein, partial [Clostridia bacterium]
MKHVFLMNPMAGTGKFQSGLKEKIKEAAEKQKADFEIHITSGVDDACVFTATYDETIPARFYAIGGDGTLNETVNGILKRKGYSELAVIPCGTGNDFVRTFPNEAEFLNLEKLIAAKAQPIDAFSTDAGLCGINMINIGIDAQTAADVHKFSRFFPGSLAYIVSLINRFIRKIGIEMEVSVNGAPPIKGNFALTSFANGKACGGGFYAAPKADVSDGLLEITSVRKVTKLQFLQLVKGYKNGTHVDDPKYASFVIYSRGKRAELKCTVPTEICIDGEIIRTDRITVEILPQAINFVIP